MTVLETSSDTQANQQKTSKSVTTQ